MGLKTPPNFVGLPDVDLWGVNVSILGWADEYINSGEAEFRIILDVEERSAREC